MGKKPLDLDVLRKGVVKARLPGVPREIAERARRLLTVFIDAAAAKGMPAAAIARSLARGEPAVQIGSAEFDREVTGPANPLAQADCRAGCAFCCILTGDDGGTISEFEARALYAGLAPQAGQPDGRAWHPKACPALDPETRQCRVYASRPMICRSYFSFDVAACEAVADGGNAPGTGVLGGQQVFLAVLALSRGALKGLVRVPTYSLAAFAEATVEGADEATALARARARPGALDKELRRVSAAG